MIFGGLGVISVNVTDGRYTYHRAGDETVDAELYSTGMQNPYSYFKPPEYRTEADAGAFLPYTDSLVWRYEAPSYSRHDASLLFDVVEDPGQKHDRTGDDPAQVPGWWTS